MLKIFEQVEALNAEIRIERDNSDWKTGDRWDCRIRGVKNGTVIECYEQGDDPEAVVTACWNKFESVIRGGITEMRDLLALPRS